MNYILHYQILKNLIIHAVLIPERFVQVQIQTDTMKLKNCKYTLV